MSKSKSISLTFNDGTVTDYTFHSAPVFTPPFYQDVHIQATNMINEAIANTTRQVKSFNDLTKISIGDSEHKVMHEFDMPFDTLPVFNEMATAYIVENFAVGTAGDIGNDFS
jgi:hypothetical protein